MERHTAFSKIMFGSFLAIVGIAVVAGLVVNKNRRVNPNAACGQPIFSFGSANTDLSPGKDIVVDLYINPLDCSFYTYTADFSYDKASLDLVNASDPNSNITVPQDYTTLKKQVDLENGKVTIVAARTGKPFSGGDNQKLGSVNFKVKENLTGGFKLSWTSDTKLAGDIPIEKRDGVFGPQSQNPQGATMSFGSDKTTYAKGDTVDLKVKLNTNGKSVKSLDLLFFFDGSKLSLQDPAPEANIVLNDSSGFDTQFARKAIDLQKNEVFLSLVSKQTSAPVKGDGILIADVKFKVKNEAINGPVSFEPNNASTVYDDQTQNIYSQSDPYQITVMDKGVTPSVPPVISATISPSSTPTQTPTPLPLATLNIKLRFQGIVSKPPGQTDIMVQVSAVKEGADQTDKDIQAVKFSYTDKGVWTGIANLYSIDLNSLYKIYIKGPKHLQKKTCDLSPQESYPGTYRCSIGKIKLAKGVNNLDFSNIILLVGDLPNQNGFVDSEDIANVRIILEHPERSKDPDIVKVGDLNLDGAVNVQDFSLMLQSLNVKYDEK